MLKPNRLRDFRRVAAKQPLLLQRGLEKECLRIDAQTGALSQKPHPKTLGHPLCHPYITTDFSESMLEIVSPSFDNNPQLMGWLTQCHALIHANLEQEYLWPTSMPSALSGPITIAQYGDSFIGRTKRLYRMGLVFRYGAWMQLIAGIHFNISYQPNFLAAWLPCSGFKNANAFYMSAVRNLHHLSWIFPLLFGHSKRVHRKEADYRHLSPDLIPHHDHWYTPQATTLRMSRLGYQTTQQRGLNVDHRNIERYVKTLHQATCADLYSFYDNISLEQQISTAKLQLENEYYSLFRPKAVPSSGKKTIDALNEKGVEYVEMRVADLDPTQPTGISLTALDMLEVLFVHASLLEPQALDLTALNRGNDAMRQVAISGLDPELEITDTLGRRFRPIAQAQQLLEQAVDIAKLLDSAYSARGIEASYQRAANVYVERLLQFEQQSDDVGDHFCQHHLQVAARHHQNMRHIPISQQAWESYSQTAQDSLAQAFSLPQPESEAQYERWLTTFLNCKPSIRA